jgi:hypothetical protein
LHSPRPPRLRQPSPLPQSSRFRRPRRCRCRRRCGTATPRGAQPQGSPRRQVDEHAAFGGRTTFIFCNLPGFGRNPVFRIRHMRGGILALSPYRIRSLSECAGEPSDTSGEPDRRSAWYRLYFCNLPGFGRNLVFGIRHIRGGILALVLFRFSSSGGYGRPPFHAHEFP